MAYIPLHHKYRPQTFADLVGQEAIATTLTNALRLQKIAPAYLFTGPRGTGKTSSARILAKSLNCMASKLPTAQPCGKCEVCSSIALGAALDIIEIDAASNTGVDNIREIIERAQYAPIQCRYKVYIIDECHMLTTAAFNSLLKTLEEPPPHVVFVLATTEPQRVLPTIISRCQRFDYRRIPVEVMAGHLTYIARIEQIEIAPASITLIAQIAQGGLRDAESLLDRLSLLGGEITPDCVWEAIGSVPERDLLGILQSIASNDPESLIDRTRTILERGKEPLTVLQNLAGCYRDLLIAKTAPKRPDLVALTSETWLELCKIAQTWEIGWILAGQKHLKDSELQVKQTTQPRLWLEIILLGLLASERQQLPAIATPPTVAPISPQPLSPPTPPPHRPQSSPTEIPTTVPSAVSKNSGDSIDIDRIWERVLQQLLPASRDLFKPFGKLISMNEQQAVVAMKSATMQTIASGKVPELGKVFSQMFGRSIAVKLEVMGKMQTQPSSSTAKLPQLSPSALTPSIPVTPEVPVPPEPPVQPPEPVPVPPAYPPDPNPLPPSPPPVVTPPTMSAPVDYLTDDETEEDEEDWSSLANRSPEQIGSDLLVSNVLRSSPPTSELDRTTTQIEALHLLTNERPQLLELEPPMDFAEPPASFDLDRSTHTTCPDPDDVEIDPLLQMATDNVVKVFHGEIIDRTHDLFSRITNNK